MTAVIKLINYVIVSDNLFKIARSNYNSMFIKKESTYMINLENDYSYNTCFTNVNSMYRERINMYDELRE